MPANPDGIRLSLPGTSFCGAAEEADASVVGLFFAVLQREPLAGWLSRPRSEETGADGDRRALMRLDAATRLVRMCIESDRSPTLAILLDSITEATREFREFERREGVDAVRDAEAYPPSCALALRQMRLHASSAIRQLITLFGHRHSFPSMDAADREWSYEVYAANGGDPDEDMAQEGLRSLQFAAPHIIPRMPEFQGEHYRDDRMFVFYIAKCTVKDRGDGFIDWTVYHADAPAHHVWALVMYRNTERYPPALVDHYATQEEAIEWQHKLEPLVPRISLGGDSPRPAPSYDEFVRWKTELGLAEYDYRPLYSPGGSAPREVITLRRKQPQDTAGPSAADSRAV